MQLRVVGHNCVKAATVKAVGPVKVELAGVVQSTWNFQILNWLGAKMFAK